MKKISKKSLLSITKLLFYLFWVGIMIYFCQFIVAFPLIKILDSSTLNSPIFTTIYSAITYTLSAALIIIIPQKIKKHLKTNREELGLFELPTFTDIGIGIIGLIITIIISSIVTAIFMNFSWFSPHEAQNIGFSNLTSFSDRLVAFFALVICAPLAEELIFRGWLYGKLRKFNSAIIATVFSSLLFGVLHGQLNVGITVGVMGAIMCLERELTGTIYAGIITHMLKNGIAFYLLFILNIQ